MRSPRSVSRVSVCARESPYVHPTNARASSPKQPSPQPWGRPHKAGSPHCYADVFLGDPIQVIPLSFRVSVHNLMHTCLCVLAPHLNAC